MIQCCFEVCFYSCLNFSRQEVAANVTILRESLEADAVLFVLVVKKGKLSFCCLVCRLVIKISCTCVCLSVFDYL